MKYGNKKTTVNLPGRGETVFDSKKESERGMELAILEKAGHIKSLVFQPRYPLEVNGVKVCTYVADFEYLELGKTVVEDVKGAKTRVYGIKKKLMKAVLGIEVRES